MEFRFDPYERRLRIRTLVPAGQHARTFVADDLFQFGIEEEYFLSDAQSLQVPSETPDALFKTADFGTSGHIGREFLQAQIEVATEPHCEWRRQARADAAAAERRRRPPRSMASPSWPAVRTRMAFWPEAVQSARKIATPRSWTTCR